RLGDIGHRASLWRKRYLRQRLLEWREGDDGEHVGDRLYNKARRDWRAVVMQDRDETRRVDFALAHQQGAPLRVAVLLDDKDAFVAGDEIEDVGVEREGADAHRIEMDAAFFERFQGLGHGRRGRAEIKRAKPSGLASGPFDRPRHQALGGLEL